MDENENESISLEEIKFVINSQVTVYQHVRNQTLRVFRILIASIAVVVAGLSILPQVDLSFVPTLGSTIRESADQYYMSPRTVAALLGFQFALIIISISLIFSGLFTSLMHMRHILGGPGLMPDLGPKESVSFSPTVVKSIEEREWIDWTGNSDRYTDWISHNSRCLDTIKTRESQMYSSLTWMLIGAATILAVIVAFLNGTNLELSLLIVFLLIGGGGGKLSTTCEDDQRRATVFFGSVALAFITVFGIIILG